MLHQHAWTLTSNFRRFSHSTGILGSFWCSMFTIVLAEDTSSSILRTSTSTLENTTNTAPLQWTCNVSPRVRVVAFSSAPSLLLDLNSVLNLTPLMSGNYPQNTFLLSWVNIEVQWASSRSQKSSQGLFAALVWEVSLRNLVEHFSSNSILFHLTTIIVEHSANYSEMNDLIFWWPQFPMTSNLE